MEQQLAAGAGERQVAEFIEHDELEPRELNSQGPGLADPGLFLEPVHTQSTTVIGAYERKVDELERQKLVLAEKTARCGTLAKGYDETFRTALDFSQALEIYGLKVRLRTSGSC